MNLIEKEIKKLEERIEEKKNQRKRTFKNALSYYDDFETLHDIVRNKYDDYFNGDGFINEYIRFKCSKECPHKYCDGKYDGNGFCDGKEKHKLYFKKIDLNDYCDFYNY